MDDLVIEIASGLIVGAGMGLVGAGGAIFTVPIFGIVLGHAPKAAFIEALAVTGGIALVSGLIAARRGLVDWRCVLIFGSAGIVGTQLATPIAVRMNPTVQVLLFALVAVVAAWRMWKSGRDTEAPEDVGPATDATAPVAPGVLTSGATGSLLAGALIGDWHGHWCAHCDSWCWRRVHFDSRAGGGGAHANADRCWHQSHGHCDQCHCGPTWAVVVGRMCAGAY